MPTTLATTTRVPERETGEAPARPTVGGKFLRIGGRRHIVRGFTYGPFAPNRFGDPFPDPADAARDLDGMRAAGANAFRTYTPPPPWLLDLAHDRRLRVLAGIPWEQHIAFLDERGAARRIEERVRASVRACGAHRAILAYTVGNEIPAGLVRWSGRRRVAAFIRRLVDAAREEDPDGLVTYANYPSTEYLDLDCLDFLCFNVYLEQPADLRAYMSRLQNLAGNRPLVMGELGLDSSRHGESEQARSVRRQVGTAMAGGAAGAFVFSWTDEWHTGGSDIAGWTFGVTTRERRPKEALPAVREAFRRAPPSVRIGTPPVSVVVCAYNAADTLADCLEGATGLRYPDYEVIVVDDGSTDATAKIAARYDVKLIRTANRGLSHARNTGIRAALGEIVAFTDADARPDPEWLSYLVATLVDGDFDGVGGPNIAPAGDGLVADCVAASPGGPVHVLLSDVEAEHIPGCNMAFRRSVLERIGGFDERYRVAGDDVDICWRVQAAGGRLGFSPAAMVWHHARDRVATYWRQQVGYGRAEALLEEKWPDKYNSAGHITWGGRVYGAPASLLHGRRRIYHGVWGQAPFQRVERTHASLIGSLATTPEWYLAIAALGVLSAFGLTWRPLLLALPLLVLAVLAVVIHAAGSARRVLHRRVDGGWHRLRLYALTLLLHLIQPAARLTGRIHRGLTPWRRRASRTFSWPRMRVEQIWFQTWRPHSSRLAFIERELERQRAPARRGGAFDRWEVQVKGGVSGRAVLWSCTEEHGQGRQLVRLRLAPAMSRWGVAAAATPLGLAGWALYDGAHGTAGLLVACGAVVIVRTVLEAGGAMAALRHAVGALRATRFEADAEPTGDTPHLRDATPIAAAGRQDPVELVEPTARVGGA